jgi:hypothetical protein
MTTAANSPAKKRRKRCDSRSKSTGSGINANVKKSPLRGATLHLTQV